MVKPGADRLGTLAYIHQMLCQLRVMAEREQSDTLAYLIEMAYLESGDLIRGESPSIVEECDRNGTS